MSFLSIRGVSRSFPSTSGGAPTVALQATDLDVAENDFVTILGPSGCGKSTLLRIVARMDQQTAGEVLLDGQRIDGPGADRGMVFQSYTLFPWLTVLDNVCFGLAERRLPREQQLQIAHGFLAKVGLRPEYARRYPRLRVLVDPRPIGKGGAVMMGFAEARGEMVGFVDADGSTPPEAFNDLVDHLDAADAIIASRRRRVSREPRDSQSNSTKTRVTASSGSARSAAPRRRSTSVVWIASASTNNTSCLSEKYRKKVLVVTRARAAIWTARRRRSIPPRRI